MSEYWSDVGQESDWDPSVAKSRRDRVERYGGQSLCELLAPWRLTPRTSAAAGLIVSLHCDAVWFANVELSIGF